MLSYEVALWPIKHACRPRNSATENKTSELFLRTSLGVRIASLVNDVIYGDWVREHQNFLLYVLVNKLRVTQLRRMITHSKAIADLPGPSELALPSKVELSDIVLLVHFDLVT